MPFLNSSLTQWNDFLNTGNHDFYHLKEYTMLDATLHGGKAAAWTDEKDGKKCLIPLIIRSAGTINGKQLCDLASPYGYPGVLSSAPLTPGDARDVLHRFHREAADEGFVSSFIRLNPFLNDWQLPGSTIMKQIYYGETISINLTANQSANQSANLPTNQSVWEISPSTFNQNHRRNIKRLHQQGLQIVVNDFSLMPEFIEAYYQTMFRRGAGNYYFFPEYYFRELKELAGDHLIFISVLLPTGEYISGGLFTVYGSVMQYHLGATTDMAVHLSPSKLVIEAAIQSGITSGATILHLGGGLGGSKNDGVFRFKAGFSNDRHTFSCLQFIHDPVAYHQLNMLAGFSREKQVTQRVQVSNSNELPLPSVAQTAYRNPNYFPQYRAAQV